MEAQAGPRDSQLRQMEKGEDAGLSGGFGRVFEQVEGISNTVNTGALDKTVLSCSSVGAHIHTRKMRRRKHTHQG